ncbi:MAG: hypothetical protein HY097_05510 [Nitrospinae bacterium]|nr:hypothetical protein [Nitrospinota bacterium]
MVCHSRPCLQPPIEAFEGRLAGAVPCLSFLHVSGRNPPDRYIQGQAIR